MSPLSRSLPVIHCLTLSSLLWTCVALGSAKADWPHYRGPQSNGHVAAEAPKLEALPDEPNVLWRLEATDGFAAPIVAGDRVVYGDLQNGKETFHALEFATGKPLWQDVIEERPHRDGFGTGPRSAPVSDGEIVLVQSLKGELHCLELASGKLLWQKNYQSDFGALYTGEKGKTEGGARHGYTAAPCIDGDEVIALAGGTGAALVCLDRLTGKVQWRSQDDQAAYSPPIVATFGGVRQVIAFTVSGVMGVDRADGALLWRVPLSTEYGRHVVAPVIHENTVIVGSHEVGLIATRVLNEGGKVRIEEAWRLDKEMGPNISTPVCVGDHLYLLVKRQVICLDARTGKQTWVQDGNVHTPERSAFAAFIAMEDRVMMLNAMGELILFRADPSAYHELGRVQVCGKNWCHPAYASGRLVVRDARRLYCLELNASE